MSQEKKETIREKLKKISADDAKVKLGEMQNILSGYKKTRSRIGKGIRAAETRVKGAKEEVDRIKALEDGEQKSSNLKKCETLQRRFQFDLDKLKEDLREIKGKIAWAKRLIDEYRLRTNLDAQGESLVQRPFAGLTLPV